MNHQLANRIEALDESIFESIEAQMPGWDMRTLLALHAAVAATRGPFGYLEIGSYRGGSLQAVIQDPRCTAVISIDPRSVTTRDETRGTYTYEDNTTERMLENLAGLPLADLSKLSTFETGTDVLAPAELPIRPDLCFIDGEHTNSAALRDARFCAEVLAGQGIIAFHDAQIVSSAIRTFVRERWADISHAVAFTTQVFAVEFGDAGVLRAPVVDRAIGSRWHSAVWRAASRFRRSPGPLFAAWSAMPPIDVAILWTRQRIRSGGPA